MASRARKIVARIAGAIVVLVIAGLLAVQLPAVQTYLIRRAIAAYSDKIDADISFESLQVRPFHGTVIKNMVILDRHPYRSADSLLAPAPDTLAHVASMSATFSVGSLLGGGPFRVKNLVVRGAAVNLVSSPSADDPARSELNLVRAFMLDSEEDDSPLDLRLDIRKVELRDIRLHYLDYTSLESALAAGDTTVLAAQPGILRSDRLDAAMELLATDLTLRGDVVDARIREFSLREAGSGASVESLSGALHYEDGSVSLSDGTIEDAFSRIRFNRLALSGFTRPDAVFSDYRMEGDLLPSHFDVRSLKPFLPSLNTGPLELDLTGRLDGTLEEMSIPLMHISGSDSVPLSALVTGRIRHLTDVASMELDLDVENIRTSGSGMDRLVGNLIPGTDPGLREYFGSRPLTGSARLDGLLDDLSVDASLRDGSGTASASGKVKNLLSASRPILLEGDIATDNLQVGKLLDLPELEAVTLRTTASAALSAKGTEANISEFTVDRLRFMGYDYTGIVAKGVLKSDSFKGRIVVNDPNLQLLFGGLVSLPGPGRDGVYSFTAQVGYADLAALHLDSRETSQTDFTLSANYVESPDGNYTGSVDVHNLNLTGEDGNHPVGDIFVRSETKDHLHTVTLDSRFLTGRFEGTESVTRFAKDLLDVTLRTSLPSVLGPVEPEPLPRGKTTQAEPAETSRGRYSLSLEFADTRDVASFFLPGLYIAPETVCNLELSPDGSLEAGLTTEGLLLGDSYVKNIGIGLDNAGGALIARMKAGEIGLGHNLRLSGNYLEALAEGDAVDLQGEFDIDGNREGDRGEFHVRGFVSRDEEDESRPLVLTAEIPDASLTYQGTVWDIVSDRLRYRSDDLEVSGLKMSSGRQFIQADGRIAPTDDAVMTLSLQDFDVSIANTFLGEDFSRLDLHGLLSGSALLVSPYESVPNLEARLSCRETTISGYDAGVLHFNSEWQEEEDRFVLRLKDEARTLECAGFLYPSDMVVDMSVWLGGLQIGYAAPMLTGLFSDFEGRLYGTLDLYGPLDKLTVTTEDTRVEDGLVQIDYTDVPYLFDGPIQLSERYLLLDGLSLRDRYKGKATVKGGLYYDHFQNLRYDLSLKATDIECLDLDKNKNDVYYGNVYGSGDVTIKGDMSAARMEARLKSSGRSVLHIPFDYSSDASAGDLLRFREREKPVRINPIDTMLARRSSGRSSSVSFDFDLHAETTPDLQVLIEVDPATGNLLSAVGSGNLDLGYHKHDFTINGDYGVTDGNYRLSAYVATRDFKIQNGSTIHFNGDIFDSDLDVTATYTTKASLAPLLADSTSTRRQVDCIVTVGDKLRNPSVDIQIDVPDLDPTSKGLVQGAMNTQDNIQRQFLALLVSGNFLPTEQSGIVTNNSNMLFSNVAAIMSDQLNNILENLGIPLDLGLNYQSNESGNDLFDVAISTQLFNDRVIVNGNIGNRQYTTSENGTSDVVGDLDIAIKLNRTGSIRATLFSHSADQYTNYLDNSQRNGAGFSYQKEFRSVGGLIKSIIHGTNWHSSEEALPADGPVKTIIITPEDGKN